MEWDELGNQSKSLIKINAFDLREALGHNACFVLLYAAIGSTLNIENPSTAHNFAVAGMRDDLINTHVVKGTTFIFASKFPLGGIWLSHHLVESARITSEVGFSDTSTHRGLAFVRADVIMWVIITDQCMDCTLWVRSWLCRSYTWRHGCWGTSCIIVVVVVFVNDNTFMWYCSPFIKYNIARVVNFVCCMVDKL